jgi:hypothetical protein
MQGPRGTESLNSGAFAVDLCPRSARRVYNPGMDRQQPKSATQALPEQPQIAPTAPKYDPSRPKRGLYGSMTWAFNNRDDLDKLGNAQEEVMRTWYRENPTAFLDRYTKLAEARSKKGRSRSQRPRKVKSHPKAVQAAAIETVAATPAPDALSGSAAASVQVPTDKDVAIGEMLSEALELFLAERAEHAQSGPVAQPGSWGFDGHTTQ